MAETLCGSEREAPSTRHPDFDPGGTRQNAPELCTGKLLLDQRPSCGEKVLNCAPSTALRDQRRR